LSQSHSSHSIFLISLSLAASLAPGRAAADDGQWVCLPSSGDGWECVRAGTVSKQARQEAVQVLSEKIAATPPPEPAPEPTGETAAAQMAEASEPVTPEPVTPEPVVEQAPATAAETPAPAPASKPSATGEPSILADAEVMQVESRPDLIAPIQEEPEQSPAQQATAEPPARVQQREPEPGSEPQTVTTPAADDSASSPATETAVAVTEGERVGEQEPETKTGVEPSSPGSVTEAAARQPRHRRPTPQPVEPIDPRLEARLEQEFGDSDYRWPPEMLVLQRLRAEDDEVDDFKEEPEPDPELADLPADFLRILKEFESVQTIRPERPLLEHLDWTFCQPYELWYQPRPPVPVPSQSERANAPTFIVGNHMEQRTPDISVWSGDAEVSQADQRMSADTIVHDRANNIAEGIGNVKYRENGMSLTSSFGRTMLDADRHHFEDTHFYLQGKHAQGKAEVIDTHGSFLRYLSNTTYSTCPADKQDWVMTSDRTDLDYEEGIGESYHAVLRFKNVPILYTPYINFPLDDRRKTGFLRPTYGDTSSGGRKISIPFYWNIAPHRDALITSHWNEYRGWHFVGEGRYLNPFSSGLVNAEYIYNDRSYGDSRGYLSLVHDTNPLDNLDINLTYRHVSDKDYFNDLGTSLATSTVTHLERSLSASYSTEYWSVDAFTNAYQLVDKTYTGAEPYKQLPKLNFRATLPPNDWDLDLSLSGELVNFQRDTGVTGPRLVLTPTLSRSFSESYGYITPSVSLTHTRYWLENQDTGQTGNPSVTVPSFKLAGGLNFERDTRLGDRDVYQTLEPSLTFDYTPYRNQSHMPTFDSGNLTFGSAQLQSSERFSGNDRVGDTKQLTFNLTSKLLDAITGDTWASASIGQVYYLDDRRVTLSDGSGSSNLTRSDIVVGLSAQMPNLWTAAINSVIDEDEGNVTSTSLDLRYKEDPFHILNLGYNYQQSVSRQLNASFIWPLAGGVHLLGSGTYSLRDSKYVDRMLGFEYQSCCWAFRLFAQGFLSEARTINDAFFIQLELKGLTSIGHLVDQMLSGRISGYEYKTQASLGADLPPLGPVQFRRWRAKFYEWKNQQKIRAGGTAYYSEAELNELRK